MVNWGYIGQIREKIRKYADTQIRKYDNWGYIGPVIRIESEQSTRHKGNIGQFGVKQVMYTHKKNGRQSVVNWGYIGP